MCNHELDCKLSKENEKYYFYCSRKNAMVDYNDCRKCKENAFKTEKEERFEHEAKIMLSLLKGRRR